ncbi:hypothetical protein BJ970_004169 [Saccharopolyspora phatthalungensis]|uniref:Uncharacterized protein n=1 Tax=Saccharopolyspora phatthalungensis TaxID=664693 RepID=A0A840QDU9_9PSEU|nr:hypothetical protein [Saccharopolyspora phatthalungensis]
MGVGGEFNLAHLRSRIAARHRPPCVPRMDECPAGGRHAPVPKQGGGGRICAKCGANC